MKLKKIILNWILGSGRRNGKPWVKDEKCGILSFAPFTTDKQLAKKYSRTPQAIRQARYRIKQNDKLQGKAQLKA